MRRSGADCRASPEQLDAAEAADRGLLGSSSSSARDCPTTLLESTHRVPAIRQTALLRRALYQSRLGRSSSHPDRQCSQSRLEEHAPPTTPGLKALLDRRSGALTVADAGRGRRRASSVARAPWRGAQVQLDQRCSANEQKKSGRHGLRRRGRAAILLGVVDGILVDAETDEVADLEHTPAGA
jgi:hypothetical protein